MKLPRSIFVLLAGVQRKCLILLVLVIAGCTSSKGGTQKWESVLPDGMHASSFTLGENKVKFEADLIDVYTGDYKRYAQTYAIVDSFVCKQDPNRVLFLLEGDSAGYRGWLMFRVEKNRIRTDLINLHQANASGGIDFKTPEDFNKLVSNDSLMGVWFKMVLRMQTFVPEAEAVKYKMLPAAKIDDAQSLMTTLDSMCAFMDASLARMQSWHGCSEDNLWFEYFVYRGQNPYTSQEALGKAQLKYRGDAEVYVHEREFRRRFVTVYPGRR